MTAILTPPTPQVLLPWFYPSAETEAERRRILASRFFLIRTAGNGQAWRCSPKKGGCGQVHDFLTLKCTPRPFSGLTRGLYLYWRAFGSHDARADLSPAERSRLVELDRAFGEMPDLASSHPQTTRSLGISERDGDLGAYSLSAPELSATALGVAVPISAREAARYAARINLRGAKPRFILEGLPA